MTKCLYTNSKYKASKSQRILLKSISFFEIKTIKLITSDDQIDKLIQKELGLKTSNKPPLDLVYSDIPSADLISAHKEQFLNDSVLLLAKIHSNKNNSAIWEALKQNEEVTVSLDMFYCGALFFRKEQVKEHFKIRI